MLRFLSIAMCLGSLEQMLEKKVLIFSPLLHNNIAMLIPEVQNKVVVYYTCKTFLTNFIFNNNFLQFLILRMHIVLYK